MSTYELKLERIIDAPRAKVWRAYSEPDLIKQWFAPAPWTISRADVDMRTGKAGNIVMRSPEGQEFPNPGVYLEVIPGERVVNTDAFTDTWVPSAKPFMTAIVTFEDAGPGKTKYTARALHWTAEDMEQHKQMGFHEGWGQCADQLEALAKTL